MRKDLSVLIIFVFVVLFSTTNGISARNSASTIKSPYETQLNQGNVPDNCLAYFVGWQNAFNGYMNAQTYDEREFYLAMMYYYNMLLATECDS